MAAKTQKPHEIFISHSASNRVFVQKLTRALKQSGIKYWYSATHIRGAREWHDEIGRALNRCDWFVVVLTPEAVRSKWVKHELLFALQSDRYNGRIVPILRADCKFALLSWTLSSFQFVDFRQDFERAFQQLLKAIGISRKPNRR